MTATIIHGPFKVAIVADGAIVMWLGHYAAASDAFDALAIERARYVPGVGGMPDGATVEVRHVGG